MRILITGSEGMLGRDLASCLSAQHQVLPMARSQMDIADLGQVTTTIDREKPEVVIHAAAFTAVDECEREPALAFKVNAEGTRNVARACARVGAALLYVSTDYVFDGQKAEPYVETDPPNPLNVYGQSKLAGGRYVADSLDRYWIVRTSWLFGPWGRNFVEAILEKAARSQELMVVDDQTGAPTYTRDLASATQQIVERGHGGIYHVTNQLFCSWFGFATEILRHSGRQTAQILPISTETAGRLARRPRNSCLANNRLEAEGIALLPAWKDALHRYLDERQNLRAADPAGIFPAPPPPVGKGDTHKPRQKCGDEKLGS